MIDSVGKAGEIYNQKQFYDRKFNDLQSQYDILMTQSLRNSVLNEGD